MLEEAFKPFFGTFQEKYETTLIELQNKMEYLESQNAERDQRIKHLEETIEELRAKKHEVYYQRKLEALLGGGHLNTPAGEIDILTSTTLYEIKSWKGFKHAYGQLKSYAKYVPGRQLALIFFGKCHMKKAFQKEYLEDKLKENIEVYQVHDTPDGNVSLELLNKDHYNKRTTILTQNSLKCWLTENVSRADDAVLSVKDIFKFFSKRILDNHSKSKIKKQVEEWIRNNHVDIKWEYQDSRINNVRYRGWKGLQLRSQQEVQNAE